MIRNSIGILIGICIVFTAALAHAGEGVIIEVHGQVSMTDAQGKPLTPQTGTDLPKGVVIKVGDEGYATILLMNGQVQKVLPHKTLILTTDEPQAQRMGIIRGASLALHEMAKRDAGQEIHAMVKAPGEEFKLTPERTKRLQKDLAQVDALHLESENGRRLMKGQIYYKYRQYKKALDLYLEIYRSQEPPSETIRSLIGVTYERLGLPDEAKKYRN